MSAELAPFTNKPDCPKCGGMMFAWAHWPDTGGNAPTTSREHLQLTCATCGWVLLMKTKDAE